MRQSRVGEQLDSRSDKVAHSSDKIARNEMARDKIAGVTSVLRASVIFYVLNANSGR